jgi:alanyl-tRNA synthetase
MVYEKIKFLTSFPDGEIDLLGMVQFKNYFVDPKTAPYTSAVTIQKCVRAGGKHNDLDIVGKTPRHHTFFEMMGNFSFGQYDKRAAIEMAWNFLLNELKLPKNRLKVTYVYPKHPVVGGLH